MCVYPSVRYNKNKLEESCLDSILAYQLGQRKGAAQRLLTPVDLDHDLDDKGKAFASKNKNKKKTCSIPPYNLYSFLTSDYSFHLMLSGFSLLSKA